MKTIHKIILFFFLLLPFYLQAEAKEVPFSFDDRDRMVRTEQKLASVETEMNSRFDSVDKRFDQLFNFLWAIIGIFTAMMVSVFGFAFWDRKLSLAPMKRED